MVAIYSSSPFTSSVLEIHPSVLFCLKSVNPNVQTGDSYAHSPHYLVHMSENGEIRFDLLQEIDKLEQEKSEIQTKLRGEKNLGNQVQLNTGRKHIRDCIETLKSRL